MFAEAMPKMKRREKNNEFLKSKVRVKLGHPGSKILKA